MNEDRDNDCLDSENNSKCCFFKVANAFLLLANTLLIILGFYYLPTRISEDSSYFSVIVAVLAILVTVLLGWQIISLININRFENNINEVQKQVHKNLGEVCGDMSACFAGNNAMIHASTLFTINALIHLSKIGDFKQCEREISALVKDQNNIAAGSELRSMFHRLTGRIEHTERISNFSKLVDFIESTF